MLAHLGEAFRHRSEKLSHLGHSSASVEHRGRLFSSTAASIAESNATPAQLAALRADREARGQRLAQRDEARQEKLSARHRQREIRMRKLAQQKQAAMGGGGQSSLQRAPSVGDRGKQLFRSALGPCAIEEQEDQAREQELDDVFAELDALDI